VLEEQGEAVGTVNKDDGKVPVRNFKRITRSAMKEKVESEEDKVNVLEQHGAAVARGKGNGKVPMRDFKRVTRSAMKVKVESGEDKVTELEKQGAAVANVPVHLKQVYRYHIDIFFFRKHIPVHSVPVPY
jgi:phage terminase large subunit-like protein